jgi:quercetin dioxygenase-like cupin family protein
MKELPTAPVPEAIIHAEDLGYDTTEFVSDKPNRQYPPHAHHETLLVTFAGYATLNLGGKSRILTPQSEIVIPAGQKHSAEVSPTGWYYMAAWRKREAEAYEAALDK